MGLDCFRRKRRDSEGRCRGHRDRYHGWQDLGLETRGVLSLTHTRAWIAVKVYNLGFWMGKAFWMATGYFPVYFDDGYDSRTCCHGFPTI